MKTLTGRTLRFANLFALAAALAALCPAGTHAETSGPGGPNLPPPMCMVAKDGNSIWANSATPQADGSTTYTTVQVNWTNGTSKINAWANVSRCGVIHFADGTVATL